MSCCCFLVFFVVVFMDFENGLTMDGSREEGTGGSTPLENHKWLKDSLEILIDHFPLTKFSGSVHAHETVVCPARCN